MRIRLRMGDGARFYSISSSSDSMIVAQVIEKRVTRRHKYFIGFEKFKGELRYCANDLDRSRLSLEIEATSLACRNQALRDRKLRSVAEYLRHSVFNATAHPVIQFSSTRFAAKALRGLLIEGVLTARETTVATKMNAVFTPALQDCLKIEADSTFRISDFGAKPLSSLFGLIKASDQILLHLHLYALPQTQKMS
jgi:polyisoprenoid-binding protein YceI